MLILDKFHRFLRRRVVALGGRIVEHQLEGYRVHSYEVDGQGTGPALVLLHGLVGSANSFFSILSGLRPGWRKIYVPDLPGHGFSRLRAEQEPLDVHGHQRLFARYVETVVREPAVLVGHSMGGALVLKTATVLPTVGVGLLASAGAPLDEAGIAHLRRVFDSTSRATALAFLDSLTHRRLFTSRLIASDIREELGAPAIRHILNMFSPTDRLEEESIRALRIPIVLAWGASERVLPANGLEYFRSVLPSHARIELLQQCGHLPMMEQPRRTVELLAVLARSETAAVSQEGTAG